MRIKLVLVMLPFIIGLSLTDGELTESEKCQRDCEMALQFISAGCQVVSIIVCIFTLGLGCLIGPAICGAISAAQSACKLCREKDFKALREQAAAMDSFKDDFDKRKAEWTKQVGNINQQRMAADERMRQMMQEGFENNQKGLLEANNKLNELNTELDDINEKFGDTLVQLYEQDKTLLNLTEMNTRIRAQQDVSLFQQTSIILHLADLTARTADSEKHILKILAVTFVKEYIKEDLECYKTMKGQYNHYIESQKKDPSSEGVEAQAFKELVLSPSLGADLVAQNVFRVITNKLIIQDVSLYQGLLQPIRYLDQGTLTL